MGLTDSVIGRGHVIPSAFIAAVIGSAKKIGSTRSTIFR
jgi:hypothetical protein